MAEHEELYGKLTLVFRDVFDDDDLALSPAMTAASVKGWDSLGHIRLMLATEKAFKVKFKASEVSSLKSVGDLVQLIDRKQA